MTEEKNYQIVTEQRGKFTVITKDKKIYHWDFPGTVSLGENYDILTILHEEMWIALQKQREEIAKKKESPEKQEEAKTESKIEKIEDVQK